MVENSTALLKTAMEVSTRLNAADKKVSIIIALPYFLAFLNALFVNPIMICRTGLLFMKRCWLPWKHRCLFTFFAPL